MGVYNIPVESASGWESVFADLKLRGLKQILMVVSDGIGGMKDAVQRQFPRARVQKCLVHKIRNVMNAVRSKDKGAIARDFKEVFRLEDNTYTKERGREKLTEFIKKWEKLYAGISRKFKENECEYYFSYLDFRIFSINP